MRLILLGFLPLFLSSSSISMPSAFSSRFIQKIKENGTTKQKLKGRVYFLSPDRVRWVYDFPEEREVCYDGRSVVNVDYGLEQVTFFSSRPFKLQDLLKRAKPYPGKPHIYTVEVGGNTYTLKERNGKLSQVAFPDENNPKRTILIRFLSPEKTNLPKVKCRIPKGFDEIRN